MSARFARLATGLAVLAVATIAAIVSYAHIESLALANGYAIGTARLLPFSVDGLIVASSLSLATGGRTVLARAGLVLGVLATVAANVVFGVRFGITGAVVNSWPAIAFIVASEILVGMLRARPVPKVESTVETHVESAMETHIETRVEPEVETIPSAPTALRTVPPPAPTRPTPRAKRTTATRQPAPEKVFATEIKAGKVPSIRLIKTQMHVGTARAQSIRAELLALVGSQGELPQAA